MNRAACAAALVALLAACGEPAPPTLDLLQPEGTDELVPGGTVPLAWSVDGGGGDLVITLAQVTGASPPIVIVAQPVGEGPGQLAWDGRDVDGARVPPEVYDLAAELYVDGELVAARLRNLAIQGVTFVHPAAGEALALDDAAVPVELRYATVSQRVLDLVMSLDPDLATPGDEIVLDRTSIPGEFVAFERFVRFDGRDFLGAPIPAGVYTVVDDVDDPDTELAYRAVGGTLAWSPAAPPP